KYAEGAASASRIGSPSARRHADFGQNVPVPPPRRASFANRGRTANTHCSSRPGIFATSCAKPRVFVERGFHSDAAEKDARGSSNFSTDRFGDIHSLNRDA